MTAVTTSVAANRPASIHVIGPAFPAFAQAAVHVRDGYIFHPDRSVELFSNGNASFFLVLGTPGQAAIDMAKASTEHAVQVRQAEYEADVKRAAQAMIEQEKKDALAKQVAEAVAASEKAIAKLRKDAEAELAKLK